MKKPRNIRAAFLCVLLVLFAVFAFDAESRGQDMRKTTKQVIDDLSRGVAKGSNEPLDGLVINHRIEKSTLFTLTTALAAGTSDLRENIVQLLGRMALESDVPAPNKFPLVRDAAVIKALLVEGFAKDDSAASSAELILRNKTMPSDLLAFKDIYISSLEKGSGEYLYLVAKAKPIQAKQLVESLARMDIWQQQERRQVIEIAQAALGNVTLEDKFINAVAEAEQHAPPAPKNRFYEVGTARDGKEVASRLAVLGMIGTPRSLLVACEYLRSTLKSYVPNIKERSIRYDALDAIRYNFPDERVLFRPTSIGQWAAAERFCNVHLGAVFDGPTPDLPPDQVYPTREMSQ